MNTSKQVNDSTKHISRETLIEKITHQRAERQGRLKEDSCATDLLQEARSAQKVLQAQFLSENSVKVLAPAKVNLFLDIGNKREDGYHYVDTVMHALSFHDVVYVKRVEGIKACLNEESEHALDTMRKEATVSLPKDASAAIPFPYEQAKPASEGLTLELTCEFAPNLEPFSLKPEQNLAYRAVVLLAEELKRSQSETIIIHIEKNIPAQAGLGGGSSDAAAALVGAAKLWGVSPVDPRLQTVARKLGSDVAFFLCGGCAYYTGTGDVFHHTLKPLNTSVVLIKPKQGISTAEAYRAFDNAPCQLLKSEKDAAAQAIRADEVPLSNNLLTASQSQLPEVMQVITWLNTQGYEKNCLMSGSGSACFARCDSLEDATRLATEARAKGWWARVTSFSTARAACTSARGVL